MAKPIAVTDNDFEEKVLKSQTPVLVDFWAEWCGPCKMIAPTLDELSEEYGGKIIFTKLDVDASPQTAMKYGVRSIPTLLVFKGGKAVAHMLGAMTKTVLKKRLDTAIGG